MCFELSICNCPKVEPNQYVQILHLLYTHTYKFCKNVFVVFFPCPLTSFFGIVHDVDAWMAIESKAQPHSEPKQDFVWTIKLDCVSP